MRAELTPLSTSHRTMSAQEAEQEQQALRRLLDSAKNDINKMMGYERNGLREQMVSSKREARKKLKSVAERYPKLEKQLNAMPGLTDSELRRRAKELKKLGTSTHSICKWTYQNETNVEKVENTKNAKHC